MRGDIVESSNGRTTDFGSVYSGSNPGSTAKGEHFVIFQKTTGDEIDEKAIMKELRNPKPVIGYGGRRTIPFITDPDEVYKGAVAITEGTLVYSERGIPLHRMRDSYTWNFSIEQYYIQGGFLDVVQSFVDSGYPIFRSPDMQDYRRDYRFTTGEQISVTDIVRLK